MRLTNDNGNGTPLGYAIVGIGMFVAAILLGGAS